MRKNMHKKLLKVDRNSLILKKPEGISIWEKTEIAEAFGIKDKTKMGAGIHKIKEFEVTYAHEVDDVLYILEGEMIIESNGEKKVFSPGDFAYIKGGKNKITIIVKEYAKLLFVTYPADWKKER